MILPRLGSSSGLDGTEGWARSLRFYSLVPSWLLQGKYSKKRRFKGRMEHILGYNIQQLCPPGNWEAGLKEEVAG